LNKNNNLNQQSSNSHSNKKKLTYCEKREIRLGLSQLNQGQRISFDDFLKKIRDFKKQN